MKNARYQNFAGALATSFNRDWRKSEVEMVLVGRFEGKHMPRIQKERQATRRLGSMRVGVRAQPQTNMDADLRG